MPYYPWTHPLELHNQVHRNKGYTNGPLVRRCFLLDSGEYLECAQKYEGTLYKVQSEGFLVSLQRKELPREEPRIYANKKGTNFD